MIKLNRADINKKYKILKIDTNNSLLRRFLDIGLIENSIIEKILIGPFGGISAYYIMDSIIAIRDKDVEDIYVEEYL